MGTTSTLTSRFKSICRPVPKQAQRVQALVEFFVAAIAIIPLFLLLPLIGKYQDISHATTMAGRYAAFDATNRNDVQGGWKPPAQLADEVRRRFFSNTDAVIKTNDTAGNFKANQNLLWVDQQNHPLIANFGKDINLSFGNENTSAHTSKDFSFASDGAPFNTTIDFPSRLQVVPHGIYRANVSVTIANIEPLSGPLNTYKEFEKINDPGVLKLATNDLTFAAFQRQYKTYALSPSVVYATGGESMITGEVFAPYQTVSEFSMDNVIGIPKPGYPPVVKTVYELQDE